MLTTLLFLGLKLVVAISSLVVISAVVQEIRRPKNLPPTPGNRRPWPFIGNALDMPKVKSWIKFREWNERFGPILTIWNGTTPTILIGDSEIATELLEKRSAKYSSRPHFVVAGDLLTENKVALFAPYGERWRAYRKALHLATMPKAVDGYLNIFEMEGKTLAGDLIRDPKDWYQLIYRYTASSVVAIAYGRRIIDTRTDVAYQKMVQRLEFMVNINVPGAQWFEAVPALQYLPSFMNSIKGTALRFRRMTIEDQAALVDEVRKKMVAGIAPHSFAKQMLEQRDKHAELTDIEFNGTFGSLFGAGVDTTSATLQSFVLSMVLHPDVQKRAHEELNRVVGVARSPTWDDEPNLFFVNAIIKEVLRWRPVAVLGGTPHASTEDDYFVYEGKEYFIPKGSIILGNLWSIHMNAKTYDNPDEFNPDRFMHGREYPGTSRGHSAFGWGRRICPGAYFAERSLFHTISYLLWGFTFSPGKSVPDASLENGYTGGFNMRPHPFECNILPRSEVIRLTIEREYKEAAEGLREFETYYD